MCATPIAMAREGRLPPVLATVSKSGTPRAALIVVVVATSLVILGADLHQGRTVRGAAQSLCPQHHADLPDLELWRDPPAPDRSPICARPYKMPFYPWPALLTIAANGALLVLFVVSDWRTGIYSLLSLALALPLYALGRALAGGAKCSTLSRWLTMRDDGHILPERLEAGPQAGLLRHRGGAAIGAAESLLRPQPEQILAHALRRSD